MSVEPGHAVHVVAHGHPAVNGDDPRRLAILDAVDWVDHPGAIGHGAVYDPAALARLRGRISVQLRVGETSDSFEATMSPWWQHSGRLVFRRDTQFRSKDFAAQATKSAAELDRKLIDALRAPGAQLHVAIRPVAGASLPAGALAIVALPIGNQGDLSPRALEMLSAADTILAEDTRVAESMLRWRGVRTPIQSCHEHNERSRAAFASRTLAAGGRLALISDAGFPLVSDPGYVIVQAALEAGASILCVPGPSAVMCALVLSGLPVSGFRFVGFVQKKESRRNELLAEIRDSRDSTVLFEAPHRLAGFLEDLAKILPERKVAVCRDITKDSEAVFRGSAAQVARQLTSGRQLAGEYTLVVGPADATETLGRRDTNIDELIRALVHNGCPVKPIAAALRETQGLTRDAAYALVQQFKSDTTEED